MSTRLEKLCKWRSILAGWHAGTKSIKAGGAKAMRDLQDKWLIMRVECSALTALLIESGVFTAEEFATAREHEAALLDLALAKLFPGFETFEHGVKITDLRVAQETMHRLGFPP